MFDFQEQLVKRVVNDLIKTLDRVLLEVAKHPMGMGMESITKYLIYKFALYSEGGLVKSEKLCIGGIGKTTLAKAMFNEVYTHFEATSFVFNVYTTAADFACLVKLQKKILKDLTNYDGKVQSVEKGISLIKDCLGGKSCAFNFK
ncbi:hypothetical protein SUGI_1033880 [Cryptomeria japonica]|nr:hypothetical protein SUGI_1033880 [Cryptomeria japonica]